MKQPRQASRRNPISSGSDWGPEGPEALEREMAVRDALAVELAARGAKVVRFTKEGGPHSGAQSIVMGHHGDEERRADGLRTYIQQMGLVLSTYNPELDDRTMASLKDLRIGQRSRDYIAGFRSPNRVVVWGVPLLETGSARIDLFDDVIAILDRDWSSNGWEWSWIELESFGVPNATVEFHYFKSSSPYAHLHEPEPKAQQAQAVRGKGKRQNPHGSEWGEQGAEAFELAMAVRDVFSDPSVVGPEIARAVREDPTIVMAALSDESIELQKRAYHGRGTAPTREDLEEIDGWRTVLVRTFDPVTRASSFRNKNGDPMYYGDVRAALMKARDALAERWPYDGHSWDWSLFDVSIPGVYAFRLWMDVDATPPPNWLGAPRTWKKNPPITTGPCSAPQRMAMHVHKASSKLKPRTVSSPEDAGELAIELIGDRAYEVFLVLYVNVRNCVVGYEEFTEGSPQGVTVQTNAMLRGALVSGAPAIITVHQHPSGDATPSDEDRALWAKVDSQCKLVDLVALDHLVVTSSGRVFSQRMGGMMTFRARPKMAGAEVSGGEIATRGKKKRGSDGEE